MRTHPAAASFALVLAVGFLTGCASARSAPAEPAEVASKMSGTFSSRAQHESAPDDYFDIRLVMVPVWLDRDDGPWLYVEQALAQRLDKPYRQRVYHLRSEGPGRVASDVFTLPGDPLQFTGTWNDEKPFCCIKPEDLTPRAGCSIHLTLRTDGPGGPAWVGSTDGQGCASDLRGASYATSRVTLTDGLLDAWDQGFDAAGGQVWGPTKGPYHFVRVSETPPARASGTAQPADPASAK